MILVILLLILIILIVIIGINRRKYEGGGTADIVGSNIIGHINVPDQHLKRFIGEIIQKKHPNIIVQNIDTDWEQAKDINELTDMINSHVQRNDGKNILFIGNNMKDGRLISISGINWFVSGYGDLLLKSGDPVLSNPKSPEYKNYMRNYNNILKYYKKNGYKAYPSMDIIKKIDEYIK